VQLTLTGPAPAWATSNHRIGVVKPNAKQFAKFAGAVAAHFKGRVDRYGIWNEPNWKSWLEPHKSSPTIYRGLYTGAYSAIKRADSKAQVLIGETSPLARGRAGQAPLQWLRQMVGRSHLKADGYAHHPYDYRHAPNKVSGGKDDVTIATLSRLTNELKTLAHKRLLRTPHGGVLPVYLTEYGYLVSGRFKQSESKAAAYTKQAFSIALHNKRVKSMLQYGLVSPPSRFMPFTISAPDRDQRPFRDLLRCGSDSKRRGVRRCRVIIEQEPRPAWRQRRAPARRQRAG